MGDKFYVLASLSTAAIFIFQHDRLLYVNPATELLTGYTSAELLAMSFYQLFPADIRRTMRTWGQRLERTLGATEHGEFTILSKGGEERWIDLQAGSVLQQGKPAAVGIAIDVSEKKRAEILQDAVYRIAQAADKSRHLDDLFPAIHSIIAEVMALKNFYIALYDKERGLLQFPYYIDQYDVPTQPAPPGRGLTEYVLSTGKSLLCDAEMHAQLEQSGKIELVGTPSPIWLGVPLCIGSDVIGVMVVQDYEDKYSYGIREQRMLEFVSSQIAMAINRKRAEDTIQANENRITRRAEELAALYDTTRDIATQRDTTSLLQALVDRAAVLLGTSGGSIYLLDKETNELVLTVAHGAKHLVGLRILPGEGLVGQVMQKLQPIMLDDYRSWEFRSSKFDTVKATSILAVPMLYSGELIGVLSVNETETGDQAGVRVFDSSDMDLLLFFAGSAAGAVHNSRLFEETRHRLAELELLYQASLSASEIHSSRAVARRIAESLNRLVKWEASIWILENKRPILLAVSFSGLDEAALGLLTERLDTLISSTEDGIVGWVCKNGQAIRTADVNTNPRYLPFTEGIASEMCVPLKASGRTIGCIDVQSREAGAFSEQDERLLSTIANQASVVIENARLFEETRQRSTRQAALNSVITTSTRASSSNIDAVLDAALEQALTALGTGIGAIWLNPSQRVSQKMVSRGVPAELMQMMSGAILTAAASMPELLVVDDWTKEIHPFAERFAQVGVRSAIVTPLLAEGVRIGGLAVACERARHWTNEDAAFIEAIGRELGSAADRARLSEETRSRINELEAINRVSKTLRQAMSMDEMLPHLMEEILLALDAGSGSIWFYDPESRKLKQVIGRGWCVGLAQLELESGEGVPGTVYATGDIYFSREMATDPRSGGDARPLTPQDWSGLSVPVQSEQETIGVFLVSAPHPREFTSDDARLLVTLAEMAGNSIHRMRLIQRTADHAADLEKRVAERTAELQDALTKAQAADVFKSEFIANINHELRTPLTNLILYYQMLRAQPTIKTEERLNVIGRELQRLRNLIEDLLNLSRLDLRQISIRLVKQDLNLIIHTLVEDRRALAEERGLTLMANLDQHLQPVPVDEPTIIQVVSNLLTNALNYTPSGGHVTVTTFREERDAHSWACFSVEDDGPGISPDDLPHLFERFYRGRVGQQTGTPGTGLGLAIVKQVVDHHQGQIVISAGAQGRGAVFTVRLPYENESGNA